MAFTYKTVKNGREVLAIEFRFSRRLAEAEGTAQTLTEWEEAVLATGVALSSLLQIRSRLGAGDYDLGYVRYVLDHVQAQVRAGKVKKEGGAVFKALVDGYLLPAYHKLQHCQPVLQARAGTRRHSATATQLKKVRAELEDARNSLRFVQTAVIYTDETRPAAVQQVAERIVQLERQLRELVA